jgi:hypothetical protein
MTEGEAVVTDGFRNESFKAEVTDIGTKEVSGYQTVSFEFGDGGPSLQIFAPNEIQNFTVPGYTGLGILIKSLGTFGVKAVLDVDDDTMTLDGIRTDPDICGKTVSFEMSERKYIAKSGEEKTNREWRIVDIEGNSTPAPKPAQAQITEDKPGKPAADKPQEPGDNKTDLETWNTIILDALGEGPKSEAEIMKAMKAVIEDKAEQSRLNKSRREAITSMVDAGEIEQVDNKYQLVT